MARNRSRATVENNPSSGKVKAVKKAEKLADKPVKKVENGSLRVSSTHASNDGNMYDRGFGETKRPAVEAISDHSGEIRTFPTKGKTRNFDKNVNKASSRATEFLNATSAGKDFKGN
jgi:hypothetical protein